MKFFVITAIVLGAAAVLKAQVAPEATSPGKIAVSGTLTYSARYSQIAEFYGGSSGQMTNLSGDFGYTTTGERHPTSITLSAGDSWGISGIGYNSGPYEGLAVSQSLIGQYWSLQLADSVSYHNGVPIGEPNPTSPNSTAEPIFTLGTTMLDNDANATLSDKLSGATKLSAGASYNQLDFLNGIGLNTNEFTAKLELSHRLGERNTLIGEDEFYVYSYPENTFNFTMDVDTPLIGWNRKWTRRVSTKVSVGPEWTAFETGPPLPSPPSFIGYSVNASVSDTTRFGSATATYHHQVTGGGGYLYGAQVDDVSGSLTRQFGHHAGSQVTVDLVGGFRRTDTLSSLATVSPIYALQGNFNATYGFAQASRQLGRHFSVYAGYSGTDQSPSSSASNGLVNGLWQNISFGLGYTPPPIHLRQ